MTKFEDVIQPLLTGLEDLSKKSSTASNHYNTTTNQFQTYVLDHVDGATGSMPFLGKGAQGCKDAVNRNVSRSQHVITKLQDFQLACDQTRKSLEELCPPYDQDSRYYLATNDLYGSMGGNADRYSTSISQFFNEGQGNSPYSGVDPASVSETVVWRIREDTLPSLCGNLDQLLTPGKGQQLIEDNINYAASCIQSDFQNYKSQQNNYLDSALSSKEINKDAWKYYDTQLNFSYQTALHYLTTIVNKVKLGYGEWLMEFQTIVGQFQVDVDADSAINAPSIGDLITDVTAPGMTGKVYLWQTPNGLMVVVKSGTNPADVEKAINQYIASHGLSKDTGVTLIGYKDGGITQQMVLDGENKGGENFKVNNLVLVGEKPMETLPANLNVLSYTKVDKETPEHETTWLGLKPDQIIIPVSSVALAFLTDGLGNVAEAGLLGAAREAGKEAVTQGARDIAKETIMAEIWNHTIGASPRAGTPDQMGSSMPYNIYYDPGDGSGVHKPSVEELTELANGKASPKAKFYISQSSAVPEESGANLDKFTHSSYLNSQLVPDPNPKGYDHGGVAPVNTGN
ncbi:hypothetical protein [Dictyobacter formicarum]|uniref:PPM-type phosphatase domain-containing protein n=1 Tax=Dictyobacter formicarum TaxID=2778368 RepID=A0ABQ3VPA9_9CHLR|nr:hypothetical protein [Dictyobacter formicarum]GHO87910.1 hypothetical protein KSZ_59160 [Dictyobacter formicarum]